MRYLPLDATRGEVKMRPEERKNYHVCAVIDNDKIRVVLGSQLHRLAAEHHINRITYAHYENIETLLRRKNPDVIVVEQQLNESLHQLRRRLNQLATTYRRAKIILTTSSCLLSHDLPVRTVINNATAELITQAVIRELKTSADYVN
jgi:hypothetical protein